jgi:hypothetical protein
MFQLFNGVPVREYFGDKTDLSFFSLTRYLRALKDCKDVRTKIKEDFFPGSTPAASGVGGPRSSPMLKA